MVIKNSSIFFYNTVSANHNWDPYTGASCICMSSDYWTSQWERETDFSQETGGNINQSFRIYLANRSKTKPIRLEHMGPGTGESISGRLKSMATISIRKLISKQQERVALQSNRTSPMVCQRPPMATTWAHPV